MLSSLFSYSSAVSLLGKVQDVPEKASPASESTFEKSLSAQVPRTKISSLSVRAIFLSIMNLFFQEPSDRRRPLSARAKDRSQRFFGMVSRPFLSQRKMVLLGKRKDREPSPMTRTDSRRLRKSVSSKLAHFECRLAHATSPYKPSCESGRKASFYSLMSASKPGGEKEARLEKPRPA